MNKREESQEEELFAMTVTHGGRFLFAFIRVRRPMGIRPPFQVSHISGGHSLDEKNTRGRARDSGAV